MRRSMLNTGGENEEKQCRGELEAEKSKIIFSLSLLWNLSKLSKDLVRERERLEDHVNHESFLGTSRAKLQELDG